MYFIFQKKKKKTNTYTKHVKSVDGWRVLIVTISIIHTLCSLFVKKGQIEEKIQTQVATDDEC